MTRTLRAVSRTSSVNRALKDGTVDTGDIAFDWEDISPLPKAFRRMVRGAEWDVCEMSLTTFLTARAHGIPLTGIPAFIVRDFHHKSVLAAKGAGVRSAKDLEGRRVGVNRGYTVVGGVWARDILFRQYDVDLSQITWARSGDEHVEGIELPPNVEDLGGSGELDEEMAHQRIAGAVGISTADHGTRLIADAFDAGVEALKEDGLYPINHLVVIRTPLLEDEPGLARAVFDAFAAAKRTYVDDLREGRVTEPGAAEKIHLAAMEAMDDPLPFGLAPNMAMLERAMEAAVMQGVLTAPLDLAGMFAADLRETVA